MSTPRPAVIVVSHTHWDREWYQPFEIFRLRLCDMVGELLDVLDADPHFQHFMLDGQTVCLEDVLALQPSLEPRLRAHIESGRLGVGPWYVLQDEFLVGAESIVRNLAEGMRSARRFGRPMPIGYLPDAFGHIAQMPRILRGFGMESAVVWRGVGDPAPGSEWRWRALDGSEVLCLFLPGGYGNAHGIGTDPDAALCRLRADLAKVPAMSAASVLLWMNGNDHQRVEASVPEMLRALAREQPDVELEHASLERAVDRVRDRVDLAVLPMVQGELRRATPTVPVLSGVWSARSGQKRDHDRAEALLVRFVEPFVALASSTARFDRRDAVAHAWRALLRCQPHDSICGCSTDEVHRDIDARLRRVEQMGRSLLDDAVCVLTGAPTADFALHAGVALVNPHPFSITAEAEVALQRRVEDGPFRLLGPDGEVGYQIVSRRPTDGPDRRPAEWLHLRLEARELPPHGLRTLTLEAGTPAAPVTGASPLRLRSIPGGLEITDTGSGFVVVHSFEDQDDRGDLYDFCPRAGATTRSSLEEDLGVQVHARVIGRRVEIDVEIDNRRPDHRLRARLALSTPPASIWTDTPFGWIERTALGTQPVSAITVSSGAVSCALGGPGLHEVERAEDGAILLTLVRAVGMMSRGDLSTRAGHAGYHLPTPDAQCMGVLRFRYAIAIAPGVAEAARELAAGVIGPRALALRRAQPSDRPFLSVEPAAVRLSIWKRADEGDAWIVRLCGSADRDVTARVRWFRPMRAWRSDLDERVGAELTMAGDELQLPIAANEVVTLRIE